MSKVIAAPPTHAAPGPPPAPTWPLRRIRRIGYAVFVLQLAGFLVWSTLIYSRFALTFDFAVDHQAWFQIAHGDLDPYSSMQAFPAWQDHSEFILWPLALLYWVWPHGVILLWLQDLCVVGAEVVVFSWICDLAGHRQQARGAPWLAGAGLVLLAANPWLWWAVSFDFHMEPVAILFAALLARDLANGRRRAWAWIAPLLACGDVAGTYLAGLGAGGVLAGRRSRLPGAVMAFLGVAATLVITLVHGNKGSGGGLQAYAYLAAGPLGAPLGVAALVKGVATHPVEVVRTVWDKRVDLLANLAPAGLVGFADPLVLPIVLVVVLENTLFIGLKFAEPIFQYLPVYVFIPLGTIAVLGRLIRRHRRAALLLAGLLVAQTLGWAAVWAPRTAGQWLRVSAPAGATLSSIEARIPASAEVIASQGIVGRFADRAVVRSLAVPGTIPISRSDAWFVVAPLAGIEIQSTASAMALIGELAGPLHATLITHAHGVWAFRWRPPPGVRAVTVPGDSSPLPAWAASGAVENTVLTGPVQNWHVTSAGKGYAAEGLAWQKLPGQYEALVTLSATGPVTVEVWNDTGNTLLARQRIPATTGVESIAVPVPAMTAYRASLYPGWGPFRADFVPPLAGNRLEVRVWSPGTGTVNVYSAEIVGRSRSASSRLGLMGARG